MIIDTTFLNVHPATVAWFAQRDACRACASLRALPGRYGNTEMRCAQAPASGKYARAGALQYCIDARLPDGPCGPHAALFKAKGNKS